MFQEPFNFSFQRTASQAVGWYLLFFLLSGLFGAIIVLSIGVIRGSALELEEGMRLGARLAPILPIVLTLLLLRKRPLTAHNVILAATAVLISFFLGFFGSGLLLAYLTTQPSKQTPASRADTFS